MQRLIHLLAPGLVGLAMMAAALPGCERKEKVLDVQTPAGDVEVERSQDDGSVDIKVKDHDKDHENH